MEEQQLQEAFTLFKLPISDYLYQQGKLQTNKNFKSNISTEGANSLIYVISIIAMETLPVSYLAVQPSLLLKVLQCL